MACGNSFLPLFINSSSGTLLHCAYCRYSHCRPDENTIKYNNYHSSFKTFLFHSFLKVYMFFFMFTIHTDKPFLTSSILSIAQKHLAEIVKFSRHLLKKTKDTLNIPKFRSDLFTSCVSVQSNFDL